MCKAKLKLQAFSYVLVKLVELQKEMNPACSEESDQDVIQTFSNTRLMKLLYLLCLEGYENARADDRHVGSFFLFDRMLAYPNGAVEQDVYDGLPLIPHTTYNGEHFTDIDSETIKKESESLGECKNSIDNAAEQLRMLKPEIFNNQNLLIDLVHRLYIWPKVYSSLSPNVIMPLTNEEIEKELNKYREEKIFN